MLRPGPARRKTFHDTMTRNRELSFDVLSRMVAAIEPAATLREADLAESGHLPVYRLSVTTGSRSFEWVLKATSGEGRHGLAAEARLLALLEDATSLPVPSVVGAVDDHRTLPAPFFVMESAAGTALSKRDIGRLSETAIERTARQTGSYLAELHGVARPDGFGRISCDTRDSLDGGRPSPDADQLTVSSLDGAPAGAVTDWDVVLRRWIETALERHASTRFGDLTDAVGIHLSESLEELPGSVRPVIGRIDHGLHNLLLDPDSGDITAVLDWGFTLSAPAAYDIVCVEANLSLEPWSMHPSTPDRRRLIRETLLRAYRKRGRPAVIDEYRAHAYLYETLALLRAMNNLPDAMPGATDDQVATVARAYRSELEDRL